MKPGRSVKTTTVAIIAGIVLILILVVGTVWTNQSASRETDRAAREVSNLYLDELAGRREQVVADNLQENIAVIHTAVGRLDKGKDLDTPEHLQQYQQQMRDLFNLCRFAFVDEGGVIYTADGIDTENTIDQYAFDHTAVASPAEISVRNDSAGKKL